MSETNRIVRVRVKTTVIETHVVEIRLDDTSEDFRSLVLEDHFEEVGYGEAEIDYEVEDTDFDTALADLEQPLGVDGAIAEVEGRTIEWVELLPEAPPARPASPHEAPGLGFDDPDDLAAAGDAWRDAREVDG